MAKDKSVEPKKVIEFDERAMDVVQETLGEFLQAGSVNAVYGEPIKEGETVIIPCAEVLSIVGFGIGSGYGKGRPAGMKDEPADEEIEGEGGGAGGGGGGRILSRPAAVVIVSPEGVRVEPVIDLTKIGLAALTAGGFMVGMLIRMMNPKQTFKDM